MSALFLFLQMEHGHPSDAELNVEGATTKNVSLVQSYPDMQSLVTRVILSSLHAEFCMKESF
jgi:hypothetical protein